MRVLQLVFTLSVCFAIGQAEARERIRIVGSPSDVGLVQPAAESFASHWHQDMPGLEATGAALGFKLFCKGVGFEHPDAVVTSRSITEHERKTCAANGVDAITRIPVGRDATVLVSKSGGVNLDISPGQLFSALATQVDQAGTPVPNPYERWSQIVPALPDKEILVMAPEPNTSASHVFHELVLTEGCRAHPSVMALEPEERDQACRDLRDDGHVVSATKREKDVIGWLQRHPNAYAVTSYTTLLKGNGSISASAIDGVVPTPETLASARYPLTTTLYIYVKDRHLRSLPSLQQLVYEITSERAISPEGYLTEQGLVPLDDISRNQARDRALRLGL